MTNQLLSIGEGVDIEEKANDHHEWQNENHDKDDTGAAVETDALLPTISSTTANEHKDYYRNVVPVQSSSPYMFRRSKNEGRGGFLRRTEESLASMGSLVDHMMFHHGQNDDQQPPPQPSSSQQQQQQQQRYHRWIVCLGLVVVITLTSLLTLLVLLLDVQIIRPARQQAAWQAAIRAQAARDVVLVQQCMGTSWQTACAALTSQTGGAGARTRRNILEEDMFMLEGNERNLKHKGEISNMDDNNYDDDDNDDDDEFDNIYNNEDQVEENMEEQFLKSDNPTVTYDSNCLREYRLELLWNITFPYRSNQLLTTGGSKYTMALFIQHGALRDAADYFCSFMQFMQRQHYRPFSEILIIAPHFQYGHDDFLHPRDAFWNASKPWGDWRVGAESDPHCCGGGRTVSSFTVLDTMLAILTNARLYPNLNKISFLGHSAGGQMVQRYAVMSTLAALWDIERDLDLKFVIANPSSYTYLDNRRFEYQCGTCSCTRRDCTCDQNCTESSSSSTMPKLSVPTRHGVGTRFPCYQWDYDRWPYGLGAFTNKHGYYIPYALRDGLAGPERALRIYRHLDVVYLVGQNDTCNDGLPTCDESCWKRNSWLEGEHQCFRNEMDTRCPAMLQGPCRRTRAYNYMNYLQQLYSHPTHTLYEIPGVGHDATAMFGSDIGLEVLFGP